VGETDGRGQERQVGWVFGWGGGGLRVFGRTSGGGAGEPQGSGIAALIEVVFRNRLGLGGIELRALVEVVGKGFPGGLVVFPTVGPDGSHGELSLGWASGGMDERGRSGLANVGEDLCDGLGLGEERDEGERCLAGGADKREDFIDPGQEGGPVGGENLVCREITGLSWFSESRRRWGIGCVLWGGVSSPR